MNNQTRITFEEVAERILSGQAALETAPEVEPWPRNSRTPADSFAVYMHPELPGCVALLGAIDKRVILCAAYSEPLRAFLKAERAEYFSFNDCENTSGYAACVVLTSVLADYLRGSTEHKFLWIAGAEAAELLESLSRHWRHRGDGVLN